MNRHMKRALTAGVMAMGIGLLVGKVQAASTDTMTVSVTPNAQFGVAISSPYAAGYSFGTVNLNSTTQSTLAITVTNNGTIYEYFGISITNTSGGWTATAATPSTDTFRMSALFSPTEPIVSNVNFSALTNMPPAVAANTYGQGTNKTSPTAGNNQQNLWLKLEMPFTLNTGGAGSQTMTMSVTGQAS